MTLNIEVKRYYYVRKMMDGKYWVMERTEIIEQTRLSDMWGLDDKDTAELVASRLNEEEQKLDALREY